VCYLQLQTHNSLNHGSSKKQKAAGSHSARTHKCIIVD